MKRKKKPSKPKKSSHPESIKLKGRVSSDKLVIFGSEYFLNYERSWLNFNRRVLHEANNEAHPLLERVNFIGIVCSNLDEFFQKRVGGLKRQYHAGVSELSVDGMTPKEQLDAIRRDVEQMIDEYRSCFFNTLLPEMEEEGIIFEKYSKLNAELRQIADRYFEKQIYPIITPLAVDESHPFPFISNKSLSLAVELRLPDRDHDTVSTHFARVKIPANRPRWIPLKESNGRVHLLSLSDLIKHKIDRFFPGLEVLSAHSFRVTRNADLKRDEEEADDLLELIEDELRERRFAEIVRMEVDGKMPEKVLRFLKEQLKISSEDIYKMRGPLGLADASQLYRQLAFNHLKFKPWSPSIHPAFRHSTDEDAPTIFEVIRRGDIIVHHPYHSFESSTQKLVEEAARDPAVLAIKQTLYRTSSNSPVMHALIRAAESDKQVAVLIELKARFDEERNISWAHKLEKAGVHVSYGIPGLKIHTKLTIIVREEEGELRRYIHIGTGNYNPDTAQLYEDFGFFTCCDDMASDVTDIFNLLTGYAPDQSYRRLLVAPRFMRSSLYDLIDVEIEEARSGRKGRIIGKMNNLDDPLIIQKLYEASNAGVKIDLIVRSVCRLIPQKSGLSEHIRVHAITGRFLEHSRCYYFRHGGEDKYYIGSADWMHRNLDARIETLAPVDTPDLKNYLEFVLHLILDDNTQRWILKPDGTYSRAGIKKGEKAISTQLMLMEHVKSGTPPIPRALKP
jgi:polyphosphate kinase